MANIGSEANIGNNAEIGDEAKIGAKAYGEQEDPVPPTPQGEVLFDGTVTLAGSDPVPIELASPLVLGATVTITLNGESFSGEVISPAEGVVAVGITLQYGSLSVATMNGSSIFQASDDPAVIGENSLKIVQSD